MGPIRLNPITGAQSNKKTVTIPSKRAKLHILQAKICQKTSWKTSYAPKKRASLQPYNIGTDSRSRQGNSHEEHCAKSASFCNGASNAVVGHGRG